MRRLFLYDNPEHWRQRSEEMRVLAEAMQSSEAQQAMLRIAADYDRLADHAERHARERSGVDGS